MAVKVKKSMILSKNPKKWFFKNIINLNLMSYNLEFLKLVFNFDYVKP